MIDLSSELHAAKEPELSISVLLENDKTRVLDIFAKPGSKTEQHQHPDHVVYAFTDSKMRSISENGSTEELVLKAGEARFFGAATHVVENIGASNAHYLVTEIKS